MSEVTQVQVEEVLQGYRVPHLDKNLLETGAIRNISVDGGRVVVAIELGFPVASIKAAMESSISDLVSALPGVSTVEVAVSWNIQSHLAQQNMAGLSNVKNVIAVASGKGGVGKSTTSVNLALALSREGANVGLLDADIYGPSQQLMLGIEEGRRPEQQGQEYLLPVEAYGLQTMSMGYLVTEKTPMVWRGPMVSGALQQLLNQTLWQDLDYLIIDMPPGTGDIQLTLSQKVPVAGAVIVTTPQDIALLDAQKGIEMFHKVQVPVLGIVENMAVHICRECGHKEHLFGEGGGQRIAKDYKVPLLGALPLSIDIREQVDSGCPSVVADPDGDVAKLYGEIARNMAAFLSSSSAEQTKVFPQIVIKND
jgi:ATP-binding protein involved in chromosome partitioning